MSASGETRHVRRTPTVARLGVAAALTATPAWAALGMLPAVVGSPLLVPWAILGLAAAASAAVLAASRRPAALPAAVLAAALTAWPAAPTQVAACLAAVYAVTSFVRLGTEAVPEAMRPAAAGWVAASSVGGILPAAHAATLGPAAGGVWRAVWVLAGLAMLAAATTSRAADRSNAALRDRPHAGRSLLCLRDIAAGFDGRPVLQSVDLDVHAGEVVAVLGPNGSGKTTLLRCIAGFVPGDGRMYLDGREISALRPEERAEIGVTLLDGSAAVFDELTVDENLRLAFRRGRRPREAAAAIELALSTFPHLRSRLALRAAVLSGGEKRLLALAQTLTARPRVLLLDEPGRGLAPDATGLLAGIVASLAKDGTAVLWIEHRRDLVLANADRTVMVAGGRVASGAAPLPEERARIVSEAAGHIAGRMQP